MKLEVSSLHLPVTSVPTTTRRHLLLNLTPPKDHVEKVNSSNLLVFEGTRAFLPMICDYVAHRGYKAPFSHQDLELSRKFVLKIQDKN